MIIPQNRATPAQVAAYREGLRRNLTVPPDPKRRYRRPALLEPTVRKEPDGWSVQLPIRIETPQLSVHPDAEIAGRIQHGKRRTANKHIAEVIATLQLTLRHCDRSRIEHFTLTRISPGKLDKKDNLRFAFKHVCDATCCWIARGDNVSEYDRIHIGDFDDIAERTGIHTWDYQQETNAEDRKRHGIRIHFRLKPRSATDTTL